MPNIDEYPDSELLKAIVIGDSGAGKTGALMALAALGYNVRILDLDNGAMILRSYATHPDSVYLQAKQGLWTAEQAKTVARRVNYVTIQETQTLIGKNLVPKGDSWQRILDQLTEWKDGEVSYGKLEEWTPREILVVDSFSRFCDSRMNLELVMNGRAVSGRQQSDYFKAQVAIEAALELLVSKQVRCHVILVCHIDYVEKDDKTTRGMPQALGKALGPKVGQHFNHAIMARTQGSGPTAKRQFITNTTGVIDLKNAAPLSVKNEYDLSTGLAEYWQAVLSPAVVAKQVSIPLREPVKLPLKPVPQSSVAVPAPVAK